MAATLMKGKPLAERIRAEVAEEVRAIGHIGLVTVLVGDDPASEVYIRLKHKAAVEAGFDAQRPAPARGDERGGAAREARRAERVRRRRRDPRPAAAARRTSTRRGSSARSRPRRTSTASIPLNAGELYLGRPAIVSATPLGVMALLAEHQIELDGARAVVIGRSDIVGKPMAHLLHAGERDRHALPLAHA